MAVLMENNADPNIQDKEVRVLSYNLFTHASMLSELSKHNYGMIG